MPGVQDPERVKEILKGESRLELVHVISPPSPAPATTYQTEAEAIAFAEGRHLPPNRKVLPYSERIEQSEDHGSEQQKPKQWVVVEMPAIIDGTELTKCHGNSFAGRSRRRLRNHFSLKETGADKFGAWTGAHINEYMGVFSTEK